MNKIATSKKIQNLFKMEKKAFKTKIFEPVVGGIIGAGAGYSIKKDEKGKDFSKSDRAINAFALGSVGGVASGLYLGPIVRDLRVANLYRKAGDSRGGLGSIGGFSGNRAAKSYDDLFKAYTNRAQKAGMGKNFFTSSKKDILKDLKSDTIGTFKATRINPEAERISGSFFGGRASKIDFNEPKIKYEKFKDHISKVYDHAKAGKIYTPNFKKDLSNKVFGSLKVRFKDGKLFKEDGTPISTKKDLKNIYRRRSQIFHPDKKTGDHKSFIKLKKEFDDLKNSTV